MFYDSQMHIAIEESREMLQSFAICENVTNNLNNLMLFVHEE